MVSLIVVGVFLYIIGMGVANMIIHRNPQKTIEFDQKYDKWASIAIHIFWPVFALIKLVKIIFLLMGGFFRATIILIEGK